MTKGRKRTQCRDVIGNANGGLNFIHTLAEVDMYIDDATAACSGAEVRGRASVM